MFGKLKRNLFISIGIAAVIYLGLTVYADFDSVISTFKNFSWLIIFVILALSLLNYITRFFKWDYYLHLLKVKISKKESFAVFMSGLVMSVTPGKMGEMLKSYIVKQITNEPIAKTAPIVLVERLTDFLSLTILALIGAYVFDYGRIFIVVLLFVFVMFIILISNKKAALRLIDMLSKTPFIGKYSEKIHDAYKSSYTMLRSRPLMLMLALSIMSWFFECFGFYIILLNFRVNFSILLSTFIYSFSTIAGAVSMLPGGLGVTEGSLTLLIIDQSITKEIAVAATFIVRVVTLWFAVFLGVVGLLWYQYRYGKIKVG